MEIIKKLMKKHDRMIKKCGKIDERIDQYDEKYDPFKNPIREYDWSFKTKLDALLQNTVYNTGIWGVLLGILAAIFGPIALMPTLFAWGIMNVLLDIFILMPNVTESIYEGITIRLMCNRYNKILDKLEKLESKLMEKAKEKGLLPEEVTDIEKALEILHTEIEKGKTALHQSTASNNEKVNKESVDEKKIATQKEQSKTAKKTVNKPEAKKSSTSAKEINPKQKTKSDSKISSATAPKIEKSTEKKPSLIKKLSEKEDENEIEVNNDLGI